MDKRYEIIELLARGLSYNLKYNTLADKIISITNRVKCPACNTGWKKPLLCDCKDGWIYPDPQKMYEALKICEKENRICPICCRDWKERGHREDCQLKQTIKGE